MRVIDLSKSGRGNYVRKASLVKEVSWLVVERCIIDNRLIPFSFLRVVLLRLFGAKIGINCRLVHAIKVKYPWNLEIGSNSWFGEEVWIYNQAPIKIGSNVCISQRSFLTAGSHDAEATMDLKVAPIVIEDGVWVSSCCVVQMGVTIGTSVVVTPNSVVHKSLDAGGVYGGNPCRLIRSRWPGPAD